MWNVRELARLFHIPPSTLQHWVGTGLVTPDARGIRGAGHKIGIAGFLEAVAIIQLRDTGAPLQRIRKAVAKLRALGAGERPLTLTLIVRGEDIFWLPEGAGGLEISALRQPGQPLLMFPVGEIAHDLLQRLGYETPAEADRHRSIEDLVTA